jgi:hypothetical protein
MPAQKDKKKITRELITSILARKTKMCNFIEYKDTKVVYKRCAVSPATGLITTVSYPSICGCLRG